MKLDPGENAVLLAPLLDISLPPERVLAVSPEELRRRQLLAMTAAVMASAQVQPVVLAVEDLHWADPTTLDLLRGIAERGAGSGSRVRCVWQRSSSFRVWWASR